jgi:2-methylisocitrate lyase-like PEP mutase family enzyme
MARLAEEVGFRAFFLAGSQISAHVLGVPNGMATMSETVDVARRVAAATSIPVMVDGDAGYGNAADVFRFVRDLAATTAAAAVFIEDKEAPTRSLNRAERCIPRAEAVGKYRAAVAARDAAGSTLVIGARCDALGMKGGSLEEAIERATAYVRDGGVDFVYLDKVPSLDAARLACSRIPAPVLPSYSGPRPVPPLTQWAEIGAAAVSYAGLTTRVAVQAVWDFLHDFREQGPIAQAEWTERARASRWGDGLDRMTALAVGDDLHQAEHRYLPPPEVS